MTTGGNPHPIGKSQANIEAFLGAFGVSFAYDEFNKIVRVFGLKGVERLDDSVINRLHLGADAYGLQVPEIYFFNVVRALGDYNKQHPVRAYFNELVWDGKARLGDWIVQATGCEDTAYTRAVGTVFIVAAVRRIMQPGCKFDLIVILEGHQGGGKSTLFKSLVPKEDWFSDNLEIGTDAKEVIEQTKGKWIIEMAELTRIMHDGHRRAA